MAKTPMLQKGYAMEEALRAYFIRAGYFAIRGTPFIYSEFDITDIDIWLYGRISATSKEIAIVDIKNKKTPQAIERIFWIQGLKQACKATTAIVATTDRRQEVRSFGQELGILVLDGNFLAKINQSENLLANRLSDEELYSLIDSYSLGKLDGDWKGRLRHCKSLLAKGLSFDNCNNWLQHAHFFAEQSMTRPTQHETALRCFYLILSFIAISLDFLMKDISFLEQTDRFTALKDGFTFGSKGSQGIQKILELTSGLINQYATNGRAISGQIRNNIETQLSTLPTSLLAEQFAKQDVAKNLFIVAKELEQLAMNRAFSTHAAASIDLRSMIACILDYWSIDRVRFHSSQT